MTPEDDWSSMYEPIADGFDAIANLEAYTAWADGFARGLRFARAEQEAAWPESWRAALRIMRDRRGVLMLHPDDARAAMAAGIDPALVRVSPMMARGVGYAMASGLAWRYDTGRVPGG